MHCLRCEYDNRADAKFCTGCGAPLRQRCAQCGFENPTLGRFCSECGAPLSGRSEERGGEEPQEPPLPSRSPLYAPRTVLEAERRQLTVMFCDLVGSTPLSGKLDPEDLREVIRAYQEVCVQIVQRFEGYVAQYVGDGLMIYFGYPLAHEDDAQRAMRAGLGIVTEAPRLNARLRQTFAVLHEAPLQVRVGIHSGLVVAGEVGAGDRREQMAIIGETPNIAARLQTLAEPDTVVISAATYRLTEGFFTCSDQGPQMLKGVSTPVRVYRVLGEGEAQNRFAVATIAGLTPLVGREQELDLLLERWEQVKAGKGQVVLLSGEPGIGKSRLVQALKERLQGETYAKRECYCSPYHQNTAFSPIIGLLQWALQFREQDSAEEKLRKLEEALERYSLPRSEVLPLFATLLSLPLSGSRSTPPTLTPQRQRQKTLEALLAWLLAAAEREPVLLVGEDLQWVDPSTLELLGLFIEQESTARILTLLTFRPEFLPPWALRPHFASLTLGRLPDKQAEAMIERVTRGKPLPVEMVQHIVTKTDGVPLFVEELTKMVLESELVSMGAPDRSSLSSAIPTTLSGSLTARLDRLDTAKEVAQLGAALGREFPYELLRAVSPVDEATLRKGLDRLVGAELLYQKGLPPQARYLFKHALIQDAAYQSLLKSKRQHYHQQIAQALHELFPETVETQPELLAHHYTEANRFGQAIPYWQKAGQRATARSANTEAISHLTKGLELLKTLPDAPERAQQEAVLQIALGAPLMATRGYTSPEVERVFARARELSEQTGETPQLFTVLRGLRTVYQLRGELQKARELGAQLLRLAQNVQDPALLLEAHYALGAALFYLGEFAPSQEHFEQVVALYNPQQHRSHAFLYGNDPGMVGLSYTTWNLWYLGYPEQSVRKIHEALALGRDLSHPFSLVFALTYAASLYYFRREGKPTQEWAEATIALASEQGFPFWLAMGTMLRGWALAEQGRGEEGVAQLRQGLSAWRAMGTELGRPHFLAMLAEAYGKIGQPGEGLTVLTEALGMADKNKNHLYEAADLYQLKGELLLHAERGARNDELQTSFVHRSSVRIHRSAEPEAEACFLQAIEIARRQGAKSLELRAVTSLSRLWRRQGKRATARQRLAEIYRWFTEGFDTPDLQAAKALLHELA